MVKMIPSMERKMIVDFLRYLFLNKVKKHFKNFTIIGLLTSNIKLKKWGKIPQIHHV